jgi:mono/diheme cytochrome c family protein
VKATPIIIGAAAFVLGCVAGVCAQTSSSAQPASSPSGNAQNGKALYLKYSCYACHSYDGHGGGGARLVPMRMNQAGFAAYIRNPRRMPPYTEKVLSEQGAADLWTYIKSLPESPAAGTIPLLSRIMSER